MKTIRSFLSIIVLLAAIAGCSAPSPKIASSQRPVSTASSTSATVEDARLLYEMGKLDDAQRKLEAALGIEPDNKKAQYYLYLVYQTRAKMQEAQDAPTPKGYYQTIPQQPVY